KASQAAGKTAAATDALSRSNAALSPHAAAVNATYEKANQILGILNLAGAAAGLTIAGLGGAFAIAAKEAVRTAAEFKALSDSTGSTVESLSRLSNIAYVSGVNTDRLSAP